MHRESEAPEAGRTVVFHTGEIPTKTHFGEPSGGVYPTLWSSEGDKVALSLNYSSPAEAAVTASSDGKKADFVADLPDGTAPYVFRAFYPSSAIRSVSASRRSWSITIPSVQTPLPSSPDEAAQLLSAISASFPERPDEVTLQFRHVTAYGRISFKNLELGEASVRKVELTATVPLCGDWYYDGESLSADAGSSSLTLVTSATENIWFACAPAALGGETLSVTIFTDKGNLSKEIQVPANYNLTAGHIAAMNIDFGGITFAGSDSFSLVTDASTLAVGDKIILVYEAGSVAMAGQTGNYRSDVSVSISDHVISELPSEAAVLTLEAGLEDSEDKMWALKSSGDYLAATSKSSNQIGTSKTVNANSSWSISIDVSGNATIKAKNSSFSRNWLLYNSSSPRFTCYASTSTQAKLIQVYRQGASGKPVEDDPITQHSEYGLYLGSHERVYNPGSDQYSREYGDSQTFAILNLEANEQLEISGYSNSLIKGDRLSVKVLWRRGYTSVMEATYEMTVVREEGPKLWLGDGTGNGFIIKK